MAYQLRLARAFTRVTLARPRNPEFQFCEIYQYLF